MIGWLGRRTEHVAQVRTGRIPAALEDGAAHYVKGDLEPRTRIAAATVHAILAQLRDRGIVETGWADPGDGTWRRWYRLKEKP